MPPTVTESVPVPIFTCTTRGLCLARVIGSVPPKQNSEKTNQWLTLTQPERLLLLDPLYMIHPIPSPTTGQPQLFLNEPFILCNV